jgi:hypothetical protein
MLTSSQNVEDLEGPDQLQTHMMYNAGVKLTFGQNQIALQVYTNLKWMMH